jgi:hypothetical protein
MTEISEIRKSLACVQDDVSYMRGRLDATIPLLATKNDMSVAINEHIEKCRRIKATHNMVRSKKELIKIAGKIAIAIGGLTAAIYSLVHILT